MVATPQVILGKCWDWVGKGLAEKGALDKDLMGGGGSCVDRHVGKSTLGNGTCKDPGARPAWDGSKNTEKKMAQLEPSEGEREEERKRSSF